MADFVDDEFDFLFKLVIIGDSGVGFLYYYYFFFLYTLLFFFFFLHNNKRKNTIIKSIHLG